MNGEMELSKLLQQMAPVLHNGEYVFCKLPAHQDIPWSMVIGTFREAEGTTLILERSSADRLELPYSFIAAWITLNVHSALEAVGLTAAVAKALARANISCNVVAAYYHDHLFVPYDRREEAMEVLVQCKM